MKKYITATIILLSILTSCSHSEISGSNRQYVVSKSDDNNWTTSALINCDSFTMITEHEVIFYVDGRKSNLKGKMIKYFSNPKFNNKN